MATTSPRLYVGTYAKYNNGSLEGAWLDLSDYSDVEEFYEACRELHKNEADPEFMFQDYEGFPEEMYSESSVSEELFEWIQLDADEQEKIEAAMSVAGRDYCKSIEEWKEFAEDRCCGQHDKFRDFAWERAELEFEAYTSKSIWRFFDIESYENELDIVGYKRDEDSGYVFDMTY